MCMLIDANLIPVVFSSRNSRHAEYKCLLEWFLYGKPKIVIGGYFFTKEIAISLKSYLPLFTEFSKLNKVHKIDDAAIQQLTEEINSSENNPDFDDPHLLALLVLSKAKLYCSEDERSYRFVKDKKFYPDGCNPPKILTFAHHSSCLDLLSDENICGIGIHKPLPKKIADLLFERI